jgi:GNAT superfamily N-acetyltransferase
MHIVRATGPDDFARAALVLGEQRVWLEELLGTELETVQPSAVSEYASPARHYLPPHGVLLVAQEGEDPIGVVAIKARGDGSAELKRMYVRPRRRARGAGSALIEGALAAAADLGCRRVVLDTDAEAMAAAYALYRRFGFRDTPPLDAWHLAGAGGMELDLAAPARLLAA